MVYGFIPSKMDGTEKRFSLVKGLEVPESYSYEKYLPKVLNQGSEPICVPCSISAHLNWNKNVDDGDNKRDNHFDLHSIYNSRTTLGNNGMTFKDALYFIRHKGVNCDLGNTKIDSYALISGFEQLKQALLLNGPCVGALPVYGDMDKFWDKRNDNFRGGHAISIVGYDKDGIIIRNSWGTSFGENGYIHMPENEMGSFYEMWTIID